MSIRKPLGSGFPISAKEGILRNFLNWELNGLRYQDYFSVLLESFRFQTLVQDLGRGRKREVN